MFQHYAHPCAPKKKKKSNVTLKIEVVNAAMPNKEDVMDVKGIISTGCVCGKV